MVTVIRAFRPHVIMTTFSGTPRDGHGHHQVSALLAKEAYETAAMDTVHFPTAVYGKPWTPLKFYRSARFSPEGTATDSDQRRRIQSRLWENRTPRLPAESRSQHKSQGFGSLQRKGVVWDLLRREATRVNESTPASAERSVFDGLESIASPVSRPTDPNLAAPTVALEAVAIASSLLWETARV
jgi:LmbE family N-acetylglucosaminyl deacetylase